MAIIGNGEATPWKTRSPSCSRRAMATAIIVSCVNSLTSGVEEDSWVIGLPPSQRYAHLTTPDTVQGCYTLPHTWPDSHGHSRKDHRSYTDGHPLAPVPHD